MKNKNKFSLILFLPCLLAGFFVFAFAQATDNNLLITEIMYDPGISGNKYQWVELFNNGVEEIKIESGTSTRSWRFSDQFPNISHKHTFTNNITIESKKFLILSPDPETFITANPSFSGDITKVSFSLLKTKDATLALNNGINSAWFSNTYYSPDWGWASGNGKSLEKNNDSWQESYVLGGTPGMENFTGDDVAPPELPKEEPEIYSIKIKITELYPSPSNASDQNEFVELFNSSDTPEKLDGWKLKDRVGKECDLAGKEIGANSFLVIKKDSTNNCELALNDTGGEILYLYNPQDKDPIFSVEYFGSAKKGLSYSLDIASWRWSKFLTPGATNIFNNLPTSKTEVPKKIYKNTYANFSAKGVDNDNDKLKYTWDFGDGHKSYLPETRHKYEKTGDYTVTLKIFDGSEEELKTFQVAVENFPALDVNIIGLSPNPTGVDTNVEYILLKNATKKKINLNGWSIATASKKDFINHPISLDLILKPKQEFKLTHLYSKFSLNNTSAKIELRYPNGKVASHVSYKSPDKSVPDDATYEKIKGGWTWKLPIVQPKKISSEISIEPSAEVSIQQPPAKTTEQLAQELEVAKNLGNFSPKPELENKKQTKFSLLNFGLHINAASAFSETNSFSNHTDSPAHKHWVVELYDAFFSKINLFIINFFLNYKTALK